MTPSLGKLERFSYTSNFYDGIFNHCCCKPFASTLLAAKKVFCCVDAFFVSSSSASSLLLLKHIFLDIKFIYFLYHLFYGRVKYALHCCFSSEIAVWNHFIYETFRRAFPRNDWRQRKQVKRWGCGWWWCDSSNNVFFGVAFVALGMFFESKKK